MNTLNHAVTGLWLKDAATFAAIEGAWKAYVHSDEGKTLTTSHFLLYAALRGKDWRKGFVHEDNIVRLHSKENITFWHWAPRLALSFIHADFRAATLLKPFGDVVTKEMLNAVREVLPRDLKSLSEEAYTVKEVALV